MRRKFIYDKDGNVVAEFENGNLVRGAVPEQPRSGADPRIQIFKSGFFEHITEHPIYCGSKADLRAVCREHNCTSDYAE